MLGRVGVAAHDRPRRRVVADEPVGIGGHPQVAGDVFGDVGDEHALENGNGRESVACPVVAQHAERRAHEQVALRGLVNAVYPQEELMDAAKKMASGIAKNAPIAVRNCKKAINEGLQVNMDEAIVIEEKLFGDCFETEDQKYGMAFFLDKNKEKVKEPFKNC